MSKHYKNAMDHLTLSDDVKQKIIANAQKNTLPVKHEEKRHKPFFSRYKWNYAACVLACLAVFFTGSHVLNTPTAPTLVAPSATDPAPTEVIPQTQDTHDEQKAEKSIASAENIQQGTQRETLSMIGTISQAQVKNELPQQVEKVDPSANVADESPDSLPDEFATAPMSPYLQQLSALSAIKEHLGYDFKIPYAIPEGYAVEDVQLTVQRLVALTFTKDADHIIYRTGKTTQNISDNTTHDTTSTETIHNTNATLKSTDELYYSAAWQEDDTAYAIDSSAGLAKDDIIAMAESTESAFVSEENDSTDETPSEE